MSRQGCLCWPIGEFDSGLYMNSAGAGRPNTLLGLRLELSFSEKLLRLIHGNWIKAFFVVHLALVRKVPRKGMVAENVATGIRYDLV